MTACNATARFHIDESWVTVQCCIDEGHPGEHWDADFFYSWDNSLDVVHLHPFWD